MTATEKIANINIAISYLSELSKVFGSRVSISSTPPMNDDDRYTYVSIGTGKKALEVFGFGDDLFCVWTTSDGNKKKKKLADIQKEIWEGAKNE